MEFEFGWLIAFIVFFALGWISGRLDVKQMLSQSRQLPDSYFKGLNFLINEQPDQAIEALVQAVDLDQETIELHFALGQLFRRRGELNRAIYIHQNLLARIDLDNIQRLRTQYELAQDFFKSGLMDRAEQLFKHLVESQEYHKNQDNIHHKNNYFKLALKALLELYVTQREWQSAVQIANQINTLDAENPTKLNYLIAQFNCELAQSEIEKSQYQQAFFYLDQAKQVHSQCSRIYILSGEIYSLELNYQKAIEFWSAIEMIKYQDLPLIAGKLLDHYRYLDNTNQGIKTLVDFQHKYTNINLTAVIFEGLFSTGRYKDAYFFIQETLRKNPNLIGLEKLLEIQILESQTAERRADLELIKNLIADHVKKLKKYYCVKCHFESSEFYWQCPACGEWESYSVK